MAKKRATPRRKATPQRATALKQGLPLREEQPQGSQTCECPCGEEFESQEELREHATSCMANESLRHASEREEEEREGPTGAAAYG